MNSRERTLLKLKAQVCASQLFAGLNAEKLMHGLVESPPSSEPDQRRVCHRSGLRLALTSLIPESGHSFNRAWARFGTSYV